MLPAKEHDVNWCQPMTSAADIVRNLEGTLDDHCTGRKYEANPCACTSSMSDWVCQMMSQSES